MQDVTFTLQFVRHHISHTTGKYQILFKSLIHKLNPKLDVVKTLAKP